MAIKEREATTEIKEREATMGIKEREATTEIKEREDFQVRVYRSPSKS